MTPEGPQWPMYAWAVAVALSVAVAAWVATNRRGERPSLPASHVAAAALIALFGWELLVYLPGTVGWLLGLTAGIPDGRGMQGYQAFALATAAFIVAAGLAVSGILRRRAWGIALGIGLALARAVWGVLTFAVNVAIYGPMWDDGMVAAMATSALGLQTVPAVAALALLLWPLVRQTTLSSRIGSLRAIRS